MVRRTSRRLLSGRELCPRNSAQQLETKTRVDAEYLGVNCGRDYCAAIAIGSQLPVADQVRTGSKCLSDVAFGELEGLPERGIVSSSLVRGCHLALREEGRYMNDLGRAQE